MGLQGRHKSIDKSLKASIRWLEALPCVTKVVFGFTESCRHKYAPGMLKVRSEVSGGLKANGYSGNGIIDLFIKIDPIEEREKIVALITERFH